MNHHERDGEGRLSVHPSTVKAAKAWVSIFHRNLPKVQGALWAIRIDRGPDPVGFAMVGHPARVWMADGVLCVLRVAVLDGQPNACSMLYGACSRTARAMGASDLVTYTLQEEPGTSLRAAGWVDAGTTAGGEHDRPCRRRAPAVQGGPKRRWFAPWGEKAKALERLQIGDLGDE